ncbi:hypothetical protein BV22DRAFT_1126830 [Leucogyrophana mollusca]|uniref:Uncharacterized protein n=1 Tax=Leucogyrophana mollusca TaxID=85980 RepID=A0ACB8BRL4_9AGAM|nr:hypothetical protein BV22DRAFT_1126830 [Leucogyrophana mollusca]
MSYNVMKELPKLPASDGPDTVADQLPHTGSVINLAKPRPHILLERRVAPEDMERLRNRWQEISTSTGESVRRKRQLGQRNPLGPFPVPGATENTPPTSVKLDSMPGTPGSQKRRGLFGRKLSDTQRPNKAALGIEKELSTKRSFKFLKKSKTTKSAPDLNGAAKAAAVKSSAVPVVPPMPKVSLPAPKANNFDIDINDGGIYFTCDSSWDASQGDATLIFVSPNRIDDAAVGEEPDSPLLHGSYSHADISSMRRLPLRRRSDYRENPSPARMHPIDELHSFLDV